MSNMLNSVRILSEEVLQNLQEKLNTLSGEEITASTCGNCGPDANCQSHCGGGEK